VENFHELELDIIFLIGAPIWKGLSFFDELGRGNMEDTVIALFEYDCGYGE